MLGRKLFKQLAPNVYFIDLRVAAEPIRKICQFVWGFNPNCAVISFLLKGFGCPPCCQHRHVKKRQVISFQIRFWSWAGSRSLCLGRPMLFRSPDSSQQTQFLVVHFQLSQSPPTRIFPQHQEILGKLVLVVKTAACKVCALDCPYQLQLKWELGKGTRSESWQWKRGRGNVWRLGSVHLQWREEQPIRTLGACKRGG